MARLPELWNSSTGDLDANDWGRILTEYLLTEHNPDGTHGLITSGTATTWTVDTLKFNIANPDAVFVRDAAGFVGMRNGTTSQGIRVYNTFTDTSNYERLSLRYGAEGGTGFKLITESSGAGVSPALAIGTLTSGYGISFLIGGISQWDINSSGHLVSTTDGAVDLGTANQRPANGRFTTSVQIRSDTAYHGQTAYKVADESLNTSTVLQNDDALSVTLQANATYAFKAWIKTNNASSTEGVKFALNGTVSVVTLWALIQVYDDTLNTVAAGDRISTFGSPVTASTLSVGNNVAILAGTIETSSTGTLVLQWAQATSGGNNLTIQRGSYLSAERVA